MNKLILGIITVIAYLCGSLCSAGGAVFMTGDFLSGYQIHTDEDRAGMYEYYAGQGLENYYMAGGAVGKTTVVLAATAVTGGGASAAVGGLGARGGFMLLTDAAVSSATFSAGNQYATTGTIDANTVVQDTAIGVVTVGVLSGGARGFSALRNLRNPSLNALPGGPGATNPAGLKMYKQFKQAVTDAGGNLKYTKGKPFVQGKTVNVNPRTLTQQQMIDEYAHLWSNLHGRGQNLPFSQWTKDHRWLGDLANVRGTERLGHRNFEFHQLELMNMLGAGHRPAFMQGVSRMEVCRFLAHGR